MTRQQPLKVALRDGTFHEQSMTLSGENAGEGPAHFQWDRKELGEPITGPVACFTDMCLGEAVGCESPTKLAILIEPLEFSDTHYRKALELRDHFDAIFTYEAEYVELGAPFKFYPFGGSWIREWHLFEKLRLCSIVTSDKWVTEGHRLRHEVVERFIANVREDDWPFKVWGEPYGPRFPHKHQPLRHYMYSIVIENVRSNWWFTEKLIDAFSQGTVPIYWGCPDVCEFFDCRGIIPFESLGDLDRILPELDMQDYLRRLPGIEENLRLARQYRCAEDWIYTNHRELFGG